MAILHLSVHLSYLRRAKSSQLFLILLFMPPKYHAFTHTTLEIVWLQCLLADEGIDLDIPEPPTKSATQIAPNKVFHDGASIFKLTITVCDNIAHHLFPSLRKLPISSP